jgi:NADPH-dependent glutamate synthase beta subunit-like oxidoreductase/NAD(P)H-flavin reductase
MAKLKLNFGLKFKDLYSNEGLHDLDKEFLSFLRANDRQSYNKLLTARKSPNFSNYEYSELIIELSPYVEKFIAKLFCIETEVHKYKNSLTQKQTAKKTLNHLMNIETKCSNGINIISAADHNIKSREGFSLTDKGKDLIYALGQINYCNFCYKQGRDFCSKGIQEKNIDNKAPIKYRRNAFGDELRGCPLEEKISEMNLLKSQGFIITPLATAIIDNPMVAATGHRICNDCMKTCIYQKQGSVDIPQIESRVLKDVLYLPWGFEIYSLLTRWNPLNLKNPLPKKDTGYKVLVAGLGPAGFTLAHYLLNEGHIVVGIDGLKIEPLPKEISGVDEHGTKVLFKPIKDAKELFEDLDKRPSYGFGGVAEYGITVRWDKNFLKIIRLLLERRQNFQMYGGIRFGSQINYNSAFKLGFDHVALAIGAGKPNILEIPNRLALGIRTASDFLMALQLTGAAKKESVANLQIRLPIVIIGGGLTAIDTATEAISYYVRQVTKFYERYNKLVEVYGRKNIEANWNELDKEIAKEFIEHALIFIYEKERAKAEKNSPNYVRILRKLGGVKILYRKKLTDAPSYRLNSEEVDLAFQEGIEFIENAIPKEVILDDTGYLKSLKCDIDEQKHEIQVRTALMAIGTSPNTVLSKEDSEHFHLHGKYFKTVEGQGEGFFISIDDEGKAVSFFGDLHPTYAGNVVKAMASAKNGYHVISSLQSSAKSDSTITRDMFFKQLNDLLIAKVHKVKQLTPNIIEVIIKAPLAAREFRPGQFFRLQNYEAFAMKSSVGNYKTTLAMEGVALTGAWVDKEKGLLSTIVLEMGGSSSLCRYLKKDEPVVMMGPTGSPTEIKSGENVILIGGGLGNAVLFSIGKAFREAGSKVLYFSGYKKKADRCKIEEIEEAADQVIWCCDEGTLSANRQQDISSHSNIVEAIDLYAKGKLGGKQFDLSKINRIIAIGSDGMMNAINEARKHQLKNCLSKNHKAIASINSPMQCMMKEICAQCLQKHVDPVTGVESYVYSCKNQDQDMNTVDFPHLRTRLSQNSLLEKITVKWIEHSLSQIKGAVV